jgi:hypothetical protein
MKYILFILLLASCSQKEQPKAYTVAEINAQVLTLIHERDYKMDSAIKANHNDTWASVKAAGKVKDVYQPKIDSLLELKRSIAN